MVAPVREYERQFGANLGDPGRRATAEDMGFAPGIADLAQGIGRASVMLQRHEEDQELSDAQLKIAKAENEWDQRQKAIQEKATPGVSTAEQLRTEMSNYYSQMAGNYKTDKARRYVQLHGVNQTGNRAKQAMAFDVDLYARDQTSKRNMLIDEAVDSAYNDPSQTEAKTARLQFDYENKLGVFSTTGDPRVDVAMGEVWKQAKNKIAWSASLGVLDKNAAIRGTLAGVAKESRVVSADANLIAQAIYGQESGSGAADTSRINEHGVTGPMQIKGSTFEGLKKQGIIPADFDWKNPEQNKQAGFMYVNFLYNKYDGDAKKVAAAYYGGEGAVNQDGTINTHWKDKKNPNAPTVGGYIDQVISRVEKMGGTSSIPDNVEPPKAVQGMPWWDDLSADQKHRLVTMAEQKNKKETAVAEQAARASIKDQQAYFKTYMKLPSNVVPPATLSDISERQAYESELAAYGAIERVGNVPIDQQLKELEKLRPQIGSGQEPGVYAKQESIYQSAKRLVVEMDTERRADPATAAYTQTYSTENPIKPIENFADAGKLLEEVKIRAPQMEAFNGQYKTGKTWMLTKGEAHNISASFSQLNASEQQEFIETLAKGMSRNQMDAFSNQVWKEQSPIVAAARLAGVPGDRVQERSSPSRAAQLILAGNQALSLKEEGEKGQAKIFPSEADIRQAVGAHMNGVIYPESSMRALTETVRAHYVGDRLAKGMQKNFEVTGTNSTKDNQDALANSIKTIVGDIATVGPSRVPKPWGMPLSEFSERVKDQAKQQGFDGRYYGLRAIDGNRYAMTLDGMDVGVVDMREPLKGSEGASVKTPVRVTEFTQWDGVPNPSTAQQFSGSWGVGGSVPSIYTAGKNK